LRIDIHPLGRKDGAEFDGDAAQAAAEIEIGKKRRTPGIEAAVEGVAWQLYPELPRHDIAMQLIRLICIVHGADPRTQKERGTRLANGQVTHLFYPGVIAILVCVSEVAALAPDRLR
jgi:hypothetical protein